MPVSCLVLSEGCGGARNSEMGSQQTSCHNKTPGWREVLTQRLLHHCTSYDVCEYLCKADVIIITANHGQNRKEKTHEKSWVCCSSALISRLELELSLFL